MEQNSLKRGDIISLIDQQTVNGENYFIIWSIDPLDIRYGHDILRKYEYDKEDLLFPKSPWGDGLINYTIIGNLNLWIEE